jgi:hypothetical protein
MKTDTFIATANEDGTLEWAELTLYRLREWCKAHPKKQLRMTPVLEKRTLSQNNYYWAYLTIISAETGDSENDLHEFFRRVFLKPKIVKVRGKEVQLPRSTTELSKTEMGTYLDMISLETEIPLPNPLDLENHISNY